MRILSVLFLVIYCTAGTYAQDTIYTKHRKIVCKVLSIEANAIHYKMHNDANYNNREIGTRYVALIVYKNGEVDTFRGYKYPRNLMINIPQLNTICIDFAGFGFNTLSLSYEKRSQNGKFGIRVPFYFQYIGGGIPGLGLFTSKIGAYLPSIYYYNYELKGSGGFATGLNLKYYTFKRRNVRVFVGPEADIGLTVRNSGTYPGFGYEYLPSGNHKLTFATFALLAKAGVCFNPTDKFNITIDGGAGLGDEFGQPSDIGWNGRANIFGQQKFNGWTGVWYIGFTMGGNF